jgi:signal transduction histidine kinase
VIQLAAQPLTTAVAFMVAFNVIIAVAYLLNGIYFAGRFRAVVLDGRGDGGRRRGPLSGVSPSKRPVWLAAQGAAALFFVLCSSTHLELAVHTYQLGAGWLTSWHMLIEHGLQGPAGILFWFLASRYLNLELTSDIESQQRALLRSEAQRRVVLGQLLQVEDEQRMKIAHDLHDDTVQVMTATLLQLDLAAHDADARTRRRIMTSAETLRAALDRTRRMMFDLRPPLLHENGVGAAVRALAEQFTADTGITVHVEVPGDRLPPATEQLVYRSIREALANVRKHAHATTVEIVVEAEDGMVYGSVRDDGAGFDPAQVESTHMGLRAARERIDLAGGAFAIQSHPGEGTDVIFRVPLLAREPVSAVV